MTNVSPQPTKAPAPRDAMEVVRATRITFLDDAQAGDRRRFTQPRSASAVEEDVDVEGLPPVGADRPAPVDRLFVVCVPDGSSSQSRERARGVWAVTLEHGPEVLEWRPGFAIVQCRQESRNDIVAALVDFAFYEGDLRVLEEGVEAAEQQAQADVALAHRVRYRHRAHWERLTDCAERCSRMRLTFARLEPQLLAASRTLSPTARSWMTRLLQKSDMESRLSSLNDRLEALEELYEGATQRISEYRWFVSGHALEIGIIVLLLIECALMSADLYSHNRDRHIRQDGPAVTDVRADG